MHLVLVVFNQLARQGILLVDDAAHLAVHLLQRGLAHIVGFGHRPPQKHFAFIFGVDHGAQRFGHAVACHHVTGQGRGTLKVIAGTSGHLVHEHFFGDPAPEQHADLAQHEFLVVTVAVLCRQAHRHAQGTATRDDGDLVNRVALGQHLAEQRMTRLVVGRVFALFLRHDHAFALGAHQDLVLGLFKVLHFHRAGTAAGGHQRRFIAQVGQISPRHAGRAAGDHQRTHILAQRHLAHVHIQNLLTATDVR